MRDFRDVTAALREKVERAHLKNLPTVLDPAFARELLAVLEYQLELQDQDLPEIMNGG